MSEKTRAEHLQWCKDRALQELEFYGPIQGPRHACISMMSDLTKHEATRNHSGILLTTMMMTAGQLSTPEQVRKHIDGFH